nr:hypothetical protein [Spelaeibacter cavernicola]
MSTSSAARRRARFNSENSPDPERVVAACLEREDWLQRGLCCEPADRSTAESAVRELYHLIGAPPPEFIWTASPQAGVEAAIAAGLPTSYTLDTMQRPAGRMANVLSNSRKRMDHNISRRHEDPIRRRWSHASLRATLPDDAVRAGIAVDQIIRCSVADSLRISLVDGVATAIRTLLPQAVRGVTWYGQQEAHRVGYYDAYRRHGLATFGSNDNALLDIQSALVGATGWWWALEHVCVMAERPTVLHTEPTPNGVHSERRLHHPDLPALEFQDGGTVFVQHGTIVPDWVVLDPTADRIARERNIEIRRCAIERIGWDAYIDMAELALVDRADDPGNQGSELALYDLPDSWDTSRILLTVNGSVERDGRRRRYGLHVPRSISTALDAAGWTYGLAGTDYSRLVRRT